MGNKVLAIGELIGGGFLTAFGMGAVGVPLISAGVGTWASDHANNQVQQANTQGQQQLNSAYAPYMALGSGATSALGRGLGIDMPANAGMVSPALPDSAPPARFNPYGDSNRTWGVLGPANPTVPWTDHPSPFNNYGAGSPYGPPIGSPLAAALTQRQSSYNRGGNS